MMVLGVVLGLVAGGVVALFTAPVSGLAFRRQVGASVGKTGQSLRAIVPGDPVAESMAEGKAAARRRMAELGHSS
jgi:gas vesicle protein